KAGADAKSALDTKAVTDAKGSANTKAATRVNQRTQARGKAATPAAKMGAGAEVQGSGSLQTR
ncbi:MAG TPA: hypothetical protein VF522_23880, partial [Ramlibacter sp.]|uniref:hypothetical protein n=1 Tax=Ramlibacter sp. TaxID=1917967 RepID=UPI002ECFCCD2